MKLKSILIWAGIILLVLLIIGILLWHSAKKAGEAKGAINISSPGTDSTATEISTADIRTLAQGIHDDMAGPNITHDIDLWNRVLVLSDNDFIKLYNEFDTDYQKDSGQTLKGWVASETAYYVPGIGTQWGTTQNVLLNRMAKLNLV